MISLSDFSKNNFLHSRAIRFIIFSTCLVLSLHGLAACANGESAPAKQSKQASASLEFSQVVGNPLSSVRERVSGSAKVDVIDLSVHVGKPATYSEEDADPSKWIVLAGCGDKGNVENSAKIQLAVLPQELVDEQIVSNAEGGQFDSQISCEK
ncbi:hypothetical protein [Dermatophilus congolensis]|uniref:hypothetical protein n=1 Tax=Dermatophilus congolensis TaxID=1863 RepID=UPI001AAE6CC6|nr:hypothetical protein [Dermatophilus congolensis]MBO3130321.1 hypothetical protein [Dermatophilus congolensis]MBO3131048.1 hypothetical protein [Dermatophilus congolensis]MBO3134792.1 hypothetical protein [Dermatophilus congolensis]MBO3137028.1 hypothetical protein [Dermatophilus congolensis]MBO3139273.1 hypothetical protein [Dermatophilus congolensis]